MSPRASYGARVAPVDGGGRVSLVDPGSPAARAGLLAGDVIVAVDGEPLRDIIDWQWLTDGGHVSLSVRSREQSHAVELVRDAGEGWGVAFGEAVFDGVRTCRNRCAFCFMTQLPAGLRRALYLRDDDYRLSFLQGNFVTLTNLSDEDASRIADQHLSPLYVSLHAVDATVRDQLVCARDDRALERFDELLDDDIEFHVQIVLVPGVNDGAVLDETLTWLAEREGVLSVGVVPLGFTAHQSTFQAGFEAAADASVVVAQIEPWQEAFRERDGVTWVYLADEFYLNAGVDVPCAQHYDGFPQYENGIGLVRSFLDESAALDDEMREAVASIDPDKPVTLVTGRLFAPVLEAVLEPLGASAGLRVRAVDNAFFGGNVSVTGLLTASDMLPVIAASKGLGPVLVPDIVVNSDGLLLDDVPAAELGPRSGADVRLLSCDAGGLLRGLRDVSANPVSTT